MSTSCVSSGSEKEMKDPEDPTPKPHPQGALRMVGKVKQTHETTEDRALAMSSQPKCYKCAWVIGKLPGEGKT